MISVGFLKVRGALRPTHRQVRNAQCGNIRKVVDGIVQEGYAASEQTAEDLGDHEAKGRCDGPAQDGRAQLGMSMAFMTMAV